MIDEEATKEKYGYYSTDLKHKSNKKIVATCNDCGGKREIFKSQYRALCHQCSAKGKYVTEATRRKMSEKRSGKKNPNWKPKIKRVCKGCGESFSVHKHVIKNGGGVFCSFKCMLLYRKTSNHPAWKGGLSFEPYCFKFNNAFKDYIRAKFGNICFLCNKTEEENGQRLSVHHVNYDKNCGCAETEEDKKADDGACQFVPLCVSCNAKVNKDRDKWEKYFKNTLRNKLSGWYI